jgi:hypothetical protein
MVVYLTVEGQLVSVVESVASGDSELEMFFRFFE